MFPFSEIPDVSRKLRYCEANGEKVDVLFVGSSVILNHVICAEFDAEMAAAGIQTHSFNLGIYGMWAPEASFVLEKALAAPRHHLRWVFLDLTDMNLKVTAQELTALRCIYWHDLRRTGFVWRAISESKRAASNKLQLACLHALACFRQMERAGNGAEWLARQVVDGTEREEKSKWDSTSGFEPQPASPLSGAVLAEYEKRREALRAERPVLKLRPGLIAMAEAMSENVRKAGAEPIFILPPEATYGSVEGWPEGIRLIAFNDADRYERLYDPVLRHDPMHFNLEGAKLFTHLLAERFAEMQR